MTVTRFDGTDDEIRTALGACDLTGALTLAIVYKKAVDGTWHALIANHDAAGVSQASLEIRNTDGSLAFGGGGIGGIFSTTKILVADGWCVCVVTKAAGTTTPRFHIWRQSTQNWVHENGGASRVDVTTAVGGTVRFGEWQDVDDANGWAARAGEWTIEMTDLQTEELFTDQGWLHNSGGATSGAWKFDGATVADLTGNGADEVARTGTTLVDRDDPPLIQAIEPVYLDYPKPALQH